MNTANTTTTATTTAATYASLGKKARVITAVKAVMKINSANKAALREIAGASSMAEVLRAASRMGKAGRILLHPREHGVAFPGNYQNWGMPNITEVAERLLREIPR